jgi:two-component system NtrC family sensor kinase
VPDDIEKTLEMIKREYGVYNEFFVMDQDGKILFPTVKYGLFGEAHEDHQLSTITVGKEYISDVFVEGHLGFPEILVSIPLFDPESNLSATLGAIVDFRSIESLLKKAEVGKTGEIYLVNLQGYLVTSTRLGAKILKDRITDAGSVLLSKKGVCEAVDYRGKKVLRAHTQVENSSWVVIADQDRDEALGEIADLNNNVFLFGLLSIGFLAIVVYLLSSLIVGILEKNYGRERELEFQVIQKEKLAALGLLTAGIAHELNTPLANALLYSQLLAKEMKEDDRNYLERLSVVEEEIKQGSKIVRNLLSFTRQSESNSKTTDIKDILGRLMEITTPFSSSRRVEIVKDFPDEIPPVRADPGVIQQVFTNLIANALDAMPEGGILRLAIRFIPVLKKVTVDVSDTGSGIPREMIKKVFDPFFTTKAQGKGTGIGLFMSYEIVRSLRGNIRVISETQGSKTGTIFTVELPVAEDQVMNSNG